MVGAVASTRLQISPLAGLSAGWGLSEELEFSVEGLGTLPIASERYSLLQIYPGLSYKLDVLRIVPRISVGAGYAGALGDNTAHGALLLVGGGVNYLWDRTTQLGLGYAFSVIPGALGSGEEGALRVLQVPTHQIRLSLDYHWGY